MDKSPDAFRTISEVAEHLDTPAHVLRFWESRFPQIRPVKRAGGRRYYRPSDVALLTGIKRLLHDEGLTIRGVQKILRDQGVRHVAALPGEPIRADLPDALDSPAALDAIEADVALGTDPAEDDGPPVADVVHPAEPAGAPARPAPPQPDLPLFAAAPARARRLAEDVTLASLLRALPRGLSGPSRVEITALARRLSALRTTLAERAEGGLV